MNRKPKEREKKAKLKNKREKGKTESDRILHISMQHFYLIPIPPKWTLEYEISKIYLSYFQFHYNVQVNLTLEFGCKNGVLSSM